MTRIDRDKPVIELGILTKQIGEIKQGSLTLPDSSEERQIRVHYKSKLPFAIMRWFNKLLGYSFVKTEASGAGFYIKKADIVSVLQSKGKMPATDRKLAEQFVEVFYQKSDKENQLKKVAAHLDDDIVKLIDDPLTIEQELRIKEFVDGYVLHPTKSDAKYIVNDRIFGFEPPTNRDASKLQKISKEYMRSKESRTEVKKILFGQNDQDLSSKEAEEKLQKLENVIDNPGIMAKEFGIDKKDHSQIFAAKTFIKAILKSTRIFAPSFYSFHSVYDIYRSKMATRGAIDYTLRGAIDPTLISLKNQLLMENDPVLAPSKVKNDLDLLLSNIYFQTPSKPVVTDFKVENDIVVSKTTKPVFMPREKAKELIKEALRDTFKKPDLEPVLGAIAALIRKEKAQVFMAGGMKPSDDYDSKTGKSLAAPYGKHTDDGVGFYAEHHSIFIGNIVLESGNYNLDRIGTLVHESLHLLFNRIVGNNSSPVEPDSKAEEALDRAIFADIKHRKSIDRALLSWKEKKAYELFVDYLEEHKGYFRGDNFNPDKKRDMSIMRREIIVRPMQLIAEGVPEEAIKKIAPNLWKFYKQYSEPLLKKYAKT